MASTNKVFITWNLVRMLFGITLLLFVVGVIRKDPGVEFILGGSLLGFSIFIVYTKYIIIDKAFSGHQPVGKLWNILLLILFILSIWLIPFEGTTIPDIYQNIFEPDTALFHIRFIASVAFFGSSMFALMINFVQWRIYKSWEKSDDKEKA